MKAKRILAFLVVLLFCSVFVIKNLATAAPYGGATSGSGGSGSPNVSGSCPQEMDTCYGARWQYYFWQDAWDNGYTIQGTSTSSNSLYRTVTISPEQAAICKQAGGFFRYAFVKRSNNQQIGVAGIASYTIGLNSSKMGGYNHYREPSEDSLSVPWETVVAAYEKAKLAYPGQIPENGFSAGSDLGWFCASYDGTPPPGPGPDPDPECPGIRAPSGYEASTNAEGWSSVRTQVRMLSSFGNFTGELWAKPGDVVQWRHCYFPGMQKVAKQIATSNDYQPSLITYQANSVLPESQKQFPLTSYKSTVHGITQWGNIYNITNKDGNSSDLPFNPTDENRADVRKLDNNYPVDQGWVGGEYNEKSSIDSIALGDRNYFHAWAPGTSTQHNWTCEWKHTRPVTGVERYDHSECIANHDGPSHCTVSINSTQANLPIPESAKCRNSGGTWTDANLITGECRVEDTETFDNGCNHGTDPEGWYYPYEVNRTYSSHGNPNVSFDDKKDETAIVKVPYNFDMSATIKLKNACEINNNNNNQPQCVYAGEAAELDSGSVTVGARYNSVTNGYYSTRVPGVKIQIITFVSDTPVDRVPEDNRNVYYDEEFLVGDMSEGETKDFNNLGIKSVNVNDIPAGKYFCVGVQVSPGSSGAETTLSPDGFTGYKKSGADCKPVAKKPSLQIWGGSLYSAGNISTARAVKNNLYQFNDRKYKPSGIEGANVFGSFDELSVMALGTNRGLASGATTADLQGDGFKSVGRFEETVNGGFCQYESPLSFANYSKAVSICGSDNNQTGLFATSSGEVDKYSYVSSITDGKKPANKTGLSGDNTIVLGQKATYSDIITETGKAILYTWGDKIHISASEVKKGKTYIVHAEGKVIINGDIKYSDEGYTSQEDIPKVIIYSEDSISIMCEVERVDAVLIAEKLVDTCSGAQPTQDPTNEKMSKQLTINGTVIADRMTPKRTFGAGAGRYSSIPAEIINYDSTLVIWARSRADTGETGVLNQTYIHELAPRY